MDMSNELKNESILKGIYAQKSIRIGFADLTHVGRGISSIMFPYGISLVASYAKKNFDNEIEVDIFKHPNNLKHYLEKKTPEIMCFSSYHWTTNLSQNFAQQIKKRYPGTIIIFGGPNFPLDRGEKQNFLEKYSAIDFFIEFEGEKAFVELIKIIITYEFNINKIKKRGIRIPNCHYIYNKKMISGPILPRLVDLDEIPSPYLSGLLDKFFDGQLSPAIQTTRGCPFSCTYCQESIDYFSKIARFTTARIKNELEYIAVRNPVPELILVDSNFGMYPQDIDFAMEISKFQDKYDWPKYITVSTGKNQKKRVLEAASILKGRLIIAAAVQSTDSIVLKNINRQNVELSQSVEVAKLSVQLGANSYSEVILCLPGDTKKSHFKSMCDMIDTGINIVRSHQLIMLPGTILASDGSRKKFEMTTRFRVYPRCFGKYSVYNATFNCYEIEEICVSNNTMSYQDYLDCRLFDLTVEIFYNSSVFNELFKFMELKGIKTSKIIRKIHDRVFKKSSSLYDLYTNFLKVGDENTFENLDKFENFLNMPDTFLKYSQEKFGINEQLNCRAIAFFERMEELHRIIYAVAKEMISEKQNNIDIPYLKELYAFSLTRKNNLITFDQNVTKSFSYDFIGLMSCKFNADPINFKMNQNIDIRITHTCTQKELLDKYIKQYGSSISGLGLILSRSHIDKFYRTVSFV